MADDDSPRFFVHLGNRHYPILVFECPSCKSPRTLRTKESKAMNIFTRTVEGVKTFVVAVAARCMVCEAKHWIVVGTLADGQVKEGSDSLSPERPQ